MLAQPCSADQPAQSLRSPLGALGFRLFEMFVSLFLILTIWPLWLIHFVIARLQGQHWLQSEEVLGKRGTKVSLVKTRRIQGLFRLVFNITPIRNAPRLLTVLLGHVSLVGPAPLPGDRDADPNAFRLSVAPGLINSQMLRQNVNIAFEDAENLATQDTAAGPLTRLAMLLRAIPAWLLRANGKRSVEQLDMFGLKMVNERRSEAVQRLLDIVARKERARVAFVNPGCVNIAMKDEAYKAILNDFEIVFPDGIGIKIACRYLDQEMRDNLNGTDLFPAICDRIKEMDVSIFLLGAREGVCEAMIKNIEKDHPGVKIAGFRHGYIKDKDEETEVINMINRSGAQMLFVAMGVPGQERFIKRVFEQLEVNVALGVGGLFDFVSGRIARAPLWMREIGMEWLYRLILEPRRLWRRYVIGNIVFLWHMVRYHK